jgi:hypothetical protein
MPLDFLQLAGVCTGAVAIGGAVGAAMQASRKAFKAEQAVTETLPKLSQELERHTHDDEMRFETMAKTLSRIETKIDVGLTDISWLKRENGGPK